MKLTKVKENGARLNALRTLRIAIVQGDSWRYDHLVDLALSVGVTVDEIDLVAHEALQALLAGAETPLTSRQIGHDWCVGHNRS